MANSTQCLERLEEITARRCLKYLRRGDENYEVSLAFLEGHSYLFTTIGTDTEELRELRGKGALARAKSELATMRAGCDHAWFSLYLHNVHRQLREAARSLGKEVTLVDIGTSETDLEKLRVASAKFAAKHALDGLRKNGKKEAPWTFASICSAINTILSDADLSLADIGTSAEELAALGPTA